MSDQEEKEPSPENLPSTIIPTSALSPFIQSNPSNIFSAAAVGLTNIIIGGACATVAIIAAPVKGAIDGYNYMSSDEWYGPGTGVVGATGGAAAGIVVGAAIGVVVAIGGVFSCLWQVSCGLIRTPGSVVSLATGQDWDSDTSEFVHYDLKIDAEKTLITDEEFLVALKSSGSMSGVFGSNSTALTRTEDRKLGKKNLADRQLYDVLGVEPEATPAEIKKSYYLRAREHHPDRNRNDPSAHTKFQLIGEAYQILSDERLRKAYDERGKDAIDNVPKMDAGPLYAMIFGSDQFEPIMGELQIATQLKGMAEPGSNNSPQYLQFRQRRREVQCAVTLAAKLDVYVNGDEELFLQRAKTEVGELTESPLGAVLLHVIGTVYKDRARIEQSSIEAVGISIRRAGTAFVELCQTVTLGSKTILSAVELQRQQQLAEARIKEQGEGTGGAPPGGGQERKGKGPFGGAHMGPGPGATDDEKAEFKEAMKTMSANMLGLLWQMTKLDINSTISNVCTKVLHDGSQSPEQIEKRKEALFRLGEEYCAKSVEEEQAMEDLLRRIGVQSGFFGDTTPPSPPTQEGQGSGSGSSTSSSSNSSARNHEQQEQKEHGQREQKEEQVPITAEYALSVMIQIPSSGIKDLKSTIERFGGSHSGCVEKGDLKAVATQLVVNHLTDHQLRQLVSDAGLPVDPAACEREMLIDLILNLHVS